jgi:hypothetical protein
MTTASLTCRCGKQIRVNRDGDTQAIVNVAEVITEHAACLARAREYDQAE